MMANETNFNPLFSSEADYPDEPTNELDIEYKNKTCQKITYTIVIYSAYLIYGIGVGLTGSCLADLSVLTSVDKELITIVFTFSFGGLLTGFLVGVPLYTRLNHNLLLSVCSFLIGSLLMVQVRFCRSLYSLCAVASILGVINGLFSLGCTTVCSEMWNKRKGPILQGLYLTVTIGAFISPQIASPFLSVGPGPDYNQSNVNNVVSESSYIIYPYVIAATMHFLICMIVFVFFLKNRSFLHESNGNQINIKNCVVVTSPHSQINLSILFSISNFLFGAMEEIPALILPIFVTDYIEGGTKQDGSQLQSLFWAGISAGRLSGAIQANRLSPATIQFINVLMTSTSIFLLTFTVDYGWICLWIFTFCTGFFSGSGIATNLSWTGKTMAFTHTKCSLLLVSFTISKMFTPYVVTAIMLRFDPKWYVYSQIVLSCLLSSIVCLTKFYITSLKKSNKTVKVDNVLETRVSTLSIGK